MKAFGGGDLLDAELSPAGVALTVNQCIHYALSRPGVALVLAGARDRLILAVTSLGFPAEFGQMIARYLGSPKAIDRMTAYLDCEKPKDIHLVVDEMLAIRSEVDAWKEKKASEEANARYNEILYYGLENL